MYEELLKYKILVKKPTKEQKEEFKELYDSEYPLCEEDISKKLAKELKKTLKYKKEEEEFEEKCKKQRYKRGYSDSDVNNLAYWFIDIIPKMLTQFRDNLTGYPTSIFYPNMSQAVSEDENEEGLIEWKKAINRMIFLLQEMNEDNCSYKNKYEEEVDKARKEFDNKYGFFGKNFEKINGIEPENKEFKRAYFYYDDPEHPEWKELHYDWLLEENNIRYYRDKCREEFFLLFSKHFWLLWS